MFPEWPTWEDLEHFCTLIKTPSEHPYLEDEALFSFYAQPAALVGPNPNLKILFVGGLGACTLAWRHTAAYVQQQTGAAVYCTPLPGHDGSWTSLQETTKATWVNGLEEFIVEHALENSIVVAHSSGSLPCLLLKRQHPEWFRAVIQIGTPLFLNAPLFRTRIYLGRLFDWILRKIPIARIEIMKNLRIKTGKSLAPVQDDIERVNVCYSFMPGNIFSTLKECSDEIKKMLPSMDTQDIFFFQGEHDLVVNAFKSENFYRQYKLQFELIKDAPHAVHASRQWKVLADIVINLATR